MTPKAAHGAQRRHASASAASMTSVIAPASSGRTSFCSVAATSVPKEASTATAIAMTMSDLDGACPPRQGYGDVRVMSTASEPKAGSIQALASEIDQALAATK